MKRFNIQRLAQLLQIMLIAIVDAVSVVLAFFVALLVRFDFRYSEIPIRYLEDFRQMILPWCAVTVCVLLVWRLYRSMLEYVSTGELLRIIGAYLCLGLILQGFTALLRLDMPLSFYLGGLLLSFFFTVLIRFAYRLLRSLQELLGRVSGRTRREGVMIIGAGEAGRMLLTEFTQSNRIREKVVCIIDDDPRKWGKFLAGVPVVGNRKQIPEMVSKYHVRKIVFAIPTCSAKQRKAILDICISTGCTVQVLPGIYQMVNQEVQVSELRKVNVQDLLGREPIRVNTDEILGYISDKTVLVTGGGGSIGSELCRQIARAKPKQLIIFEIYENNAYDIQQELRRQYPKLNLEVLIGSVRNTARVEYLMSTYKPDLVFHAAAHKHVPLMEDSPNEAIKNNVFGTYKMAKAAAAHGVKRFVLISTDKAVNPTNIMGASKRLCEMVVQMMSRCSATEFVAVRFGNVLGSNGSVIPLFRKQIETGGPVTVTHPDIIRYFMTIPEAVSLVLQAGYYARGGEIFILDMGDPVRIDDMARNMIRLSGLEPDVDIPIVYTGLRPGEKLYEELLMAEEGIQDTANKLIHIGKPIEMDDELFRQQLEELEAAYKAEASNMKELVARIVPTYHPGQQSSLP